MKDLKFKESDTKQFVTTQSLFQYDSLEHLYWGERGKKQGRNDKCRCGSGKKFKRCCYSKVGSTGRESLLKHLTGGNLGKELNPDGYVPYVVGWKDLKNEEFNERFMEFLKVYPVLQSGCFFNSFKLMYEMRDLGVEQVHGWYGFDVGGCVEYNTWVNRYLDGKRGKEYVYDSTRKDDEYSYWPGYDSVWDYDRGLVWKRHAWNKLNGVHFDSTRETMSNPGWVYYNEMYSQDMMDLMLSDLDTKKLPNLLKQLQYSVQSVSNFYDETLCVKGKHDSRLKLEELEYKFN